MANPVSSSSPAKPAQVGATDPASQSALQTPAQARAEIAVMVPVTSASAPRSEASVPSTPLYLLATFSMILPWFGIVLILWGGYGLATEVTSGRAVAWTLIGSGAACIVLDILIDAVWAMPALSASNEPTLNRPGSELIGRLATVSEPIADGRGKVQIADSTWMAEGDDARIGETVRVISTRDTVLLVAPMPAPSS